MEQNIILIDRLSDAGFPPQSALSRKERISHAGSGSDAISLVSSSSATRLVIFPYELADMTGPEFCRYVRSCDESRSISLLFLGEEDERGHAELCLAAGCNDYALKPVDIRELERKIERLTSVPVRKELRTLTKLNVDLDSGGKTLTGHSLNISTSGMLIQMQQVLPPEATVRLNFYLHGERELLDLDAQVVRAEFTGGTPKYGVQFIQPSAEGLQRISNFVKRHGR